MRLLPRLLRLLRLPLLLLLHRAAAAPCCWPCRLEGRPLWLLLVLLLRLLLHRPCRAQGQLPWLPLTLLLLLLLPLRPPLLRLLLRLLSASQPRLPPNLRRCLL